MSLTYTTDFVASCLAFRRARTGIFVFDLSYLGKWGMREARCGIHALYRQEKFGPIHTSTGHGYLAPGILTFARLKAELFADSFVVYRMGSLRPIPSAYTKLALGHHPLIVFVPIVSGGMDELRVLGKNTSPEWWEVLVKRICHAVTKPASRRLTGS